jgi:hypothetical protein
MRLFLVMAVLSTWPLVGCDDKGLEGEAATDTEPPVLVVDRPDRGTLSSGSGFIRVEGRASDDVGLDHVEVNGERAGVDASGNFSVTITPPSGMFLINVVAVDKAENSTSDTRAILTGNFVPLDQPVENALAVSLSPAAFTAVGDVAAGVVAGLDLGAVVAPLNPVMDVGVTCLNAQIAVAGVEKTAVRLQLVPGAGRLELTAEIDGLDVPLDVPFEAACANGQASARLRADRFVVSGQVVLGVDGGGLAVSLEEVIADFEGFDLNVGAIPDAVVDLFRDQIDDIVSGILVDQIDALLAPQLESAIAGIAAGRTIDILGTPLVLTAVPSAIEMTESGASLVLDASLSTEGEPGIGYLASPEPVPVLDRSADFAVAAADDALNQMLTAMWVAGGLDVTIPLGGGEYGQVGVLFDRVHLTALLPPVVQSGEDGLSIALGDVRCAFEKGDGGSTVATTSVVVNAKAALSVTPSEDGTLRLQFADPDVFADFEETGGANPLAQEEVEELVSFMTTRVLAVAGDVLGQVPVPSIAGVTVEDLAVSLGTEAPGYLVASGSLVPAAP